MALYTKGPTADERKMMDSLGISEADIVRPHADVWPEHATLVEVLAYSPWRHHAMGGRIGLDYVQLQAVLELLDIPRSTWRQLMDDIRVIESTALPLF